MRPLTLRLLVPACLMATPVFAHGGHAHESATAGWTWDPWITMPLALAAVLFTLGWRRLHRRSRRGSAGLRERACLFVGGWLLLAGALVSPLHEAGERSFTAHMIEHEILMLLATPLLVLSEPLVVMLWAFPPAARRALGRIGASASVTWTWHRLSAPVTATVVQAAVLWLWHAPALFSLALANEAWHAVQHLCFVVSALLFWSAMLGRRGRRSPDMGARGLAALCLFVTSLVSGALGALMAFSQSPWYPAYARLGLTPLGLTPAEDQQLAGLIMWVPGGVVHAAAALLLMHSIFKARPRGLADAR